VTKDASISDRSGAHPGVACDGCGACPLHGVRYAMRERDWDLCSACFEQQGLQLGRSEVDPSRPDWPRVCTFDKLEHALDRDVVSAKVAAARPLMLLDRGAAFAPALQQLLVEAGAARPAYRVHWMNSEHKGLNTLEEHLRECGFQVDAVAPDPKRARVGS
jgi:hypothetical protein